MVGAHIHHTRALWYEVGYGAQAGRQCNHACSDGVRLRQIVIDLFQQFVRILAVYQAGFG